MYYVMNMSICPLTVGTCSEGIHLYKMHNCLLSCTCPLCSIFPPAGECLYVSCTDVRDPFYKAFINISQLILWLSFLLQFYGTNLIITIVCTSTDSNAVGGCAKCGDDQTHTIWITAYMYIFMKSDLEMKIFCKTGPGSYIKRAPPSFNFLFLAYWPFKRCYKCKYLGDCNITKHH